MLKRSNRTPIQVPIKILFTEIVQARDKKRLWLLNVLFFPMEWYQVRSSGCSADRGNHLRAEDPWIKGFISLWAHGLRERRGERLGMERYWVKVENNASVKPLLPGIGMHIYVWKWLVWGQKTESLTATLSKNCNALSVYYIWCEEGSFSPWGLPSKSS